MRIILDTRKSNDHDAIPHAKPAKPRNSRNLRDGDAVGVLLVVRLLLLGAGLAGDGAGMGGAHDRIVRFDSKDWVVSLILTKKIRVLTIWLMMFHKK